LNIRIHICCEQAICNKLYSTMKNRSCSLLDFYAPLLSEIYWFIFFHLQKDRIDRSKKLTKDLQEMFQNHEQHKRIIFDDIFFINRKDENDPEINRLKTKLVEVAFRQKSWGKRMPTSVYLCYFFCYYTHIKISMVTFYLLIKYSIKVEYQNTYLLWTGYL
jgi:hypothetical protein